MSNAKNAPEWHNCDGEVSRLVQRLRWRRRSGRIRQGTLFGLLAFAVFAGSYLYPEMVVRMEASATGSNCEHYMQQMRAFYCEGSGVDLDPALWEHLATCSDCRRSLSLYGNMSSWRMAHSPRREHAHAEPGQTHRLKVDPSLGSALFAPSR
jgi:hypothetical protein